jgi:uncharacterized membrane protein YfhO
VAVADKKFADVLGQAIVQDSVSVVTIESYDPNRLAYNVHSSKGGVVVFSEIFYPGWQATIDGQPAELGRVDYVLRALQVPAGQHKVELTFKPRSIQTTETIAYASLGVLFVLVLVVIGLSVRRRKSA